MSTRFTGIAFGTGPVGYQGDKDEKIREVVEKIEKQTKEAGLPWWAGLFNPEIVKLADVERCVCDHVKEEREMELREKIKKVKEANERILKEREKEHREKLEKMDEVMMRALSHVERDMRKVCEAIEREGAPYEQIVELSRTMAQLSTQAASLRMSMGLPPTMLPPFGMGINSGSYAPSNDT